MCPESFQMSLMCVDKRKVIIIDCPYAIFPQKSYLHVLRMTTEQLFGTAQRRSAEQTSVTKNKETAALLATELGKWLPLQ